MLCIYQLLRALVKLWQSKGIRCLDDGVITVASYDKVQINSTIVKDTLKVAGFVINTSKSLWRPEHGSYYVFIIGKHLHTHSKNRKPQSTIAPGWQGTGITSQSGSQAG